MENHICDCICHKEPVLHIMACCKQCLNCKEYIVLSKVQEHKQKCRDKKDEYNRLS